MNKKTVIAALLALALALSITAFDDYAFGDGKTKRCHKGLEKKFFGKVYLILKNQDELDLSDKQVEEIKDLKIKTKKDLIRKKAELDIVALDMKTAMLEKQIDTGAVNKLIDKKYDLKKEKAKSLVAAYAAVKGILTDKQKEELKDLWKKCKKEMTHGSMKKGKMGHPTMSGKR